MKRTLGIDLGTNSLGWGIVGNKQIIDCGVLVFEQGIPTEKGTEVSPAAERTDFRAARRLKFRRRLRKYHTLKILIENQMCPLSIDELKKWIREGVFPIGNEKFITWLNSTKERNPYYFRAQAAIRPLPPLELGRALYHIALRRGFKSSKKDQSTADKDTGVLKTKISELKRLLDERDITLGQYLYELFEKDDGIRGKEKCGRVEHYIPEFNKICEVQKIPFSLKKALHGALFMQRPLRSQKHLAGHCPLEKKYTRCLISHPLFERFRMLAFINTIKVKREGETKFRFLNADERLFIEKQFFVKKSTFAFEKLKKALWKKFFAKENVEFNYRDDQTISSSLVTHQLQTILGCEDIFKWRHSYIDRRQSQKEMDYQTFFDGIKYFKVDYDEEDKAFYDFAVNRIGLSAENAENLQKIVLPDGYARYSLNAIRKIVPLLEAGLIEPYAVFLAKLPDVMGAEIFNSSKEEIISDFYQCVDDYNWEKNNLEGKERRNCLSLSDRFRQLLEDKWHIPMGKSEKLYVFQEPSNYKDCSQSGVLPRVDLGMIYNPMVHRSLTVLRRLVNHLRKSGKIDDETEIHVELTREVNDKNSRLAYIQYQKENEQKRQKAVAEFAERGIIPSDEQILRWRLWDEQKQHCLYTGRKIEAEEIFCPLENVTVDIEHTIPRSLGGDNSMENLTLCDSTYNRGVKIGKLPSECPNYEVPTHDYPATVIDNLYAAGFYQKLEEAEKRYNALYSAAKSASPETRAKCRQNMLAQRFKLNYWRSKLHTFEIGKDEIEGFSRRQLAVTGVMARHALQFLKSVYSNVYATNGVITAFVRQAWGLQKQYESKSRADHTHHAIDAIVIATLNREMLSRIAAASHEDELKKYIRSVLPMSYPWKEFPEDVYYAVEKIMINHLNRHNEMKQTKRNKIRLANPIKIDDNNMVSFVKGAGDTVRGALHDQTYYGCIKDKSGKELFVLLVPLDDDNFSAISDFEKIVDAGVKNAIIAQVQKYIEQGMSFKEALNQPIRMKTKSGNYDGPVIKKVRTLYAQVTLLSLDSDNFKNADTIEKIIDIEIRHAVFAQVQQYMKQGMSFAEAMNQPFYKKTKNGYDGERIEKVRILLKPNISDPIKVKKQTYESRHDYKNHINAAAAKGSNFMVALYRTAGADADRREYKYRLIQLWDWAFDHRQPDYVPPQSDTSFGEFVGFVNPGVSVLFYRTSPEELKQMDGKELGRRLYRVTEFSSDGRICLRWHREARAKTDVKKIMKEQFDCSESSKMPWDEQYLLLKISPSSFQGHTLFEGIDFDITLDGKIRFRE